MEAYVFLLCGQLNINLNCLIGFLWEKVKSMDNNISYVAGGQTYMFCTTLTFKENSNDYVARQVYKQVSADRNNGLSNSIIKTEPSTAEKGIMSESNIQEWAKTTNIVFTDYLCKKKLLMKYMSDFMNGYTIEKF